MSWPGRADHIGGIGHAHGSPMRAGLDRADADDPLSDAVALGDGVGEVVLALQ